MSYREQRDYENLNKAIFEGTGEYGIPVIASSDSDAPEVDNWIGFNYARGCEEPEQHGIHFFIDDYQFVRVWKQPDVYLNMLRKFQAVCTPDFSTYTDFPKVIQIYNHYRKHWLGAYWQMAWYPGDTHHQLGRPGQLGLVFCGRTGGLHGRGQFCWNAEQ